jgi:transposase
VSCRTVFNCWERYHREGVAGLLEGEHTGRPSRLSGEQQETLCEILDSGPVAYGFETGLWTAPRIAQVIEAEFQVQYHSHHVCKLLAQLGFSIQRPTRQLAAADPERQQKWVRSMKLSPRWSPVCALRSGTYSVTLNRSAVICSPIISAENYATSYTNTQRWPPRWNPPRLVGGDSWNRRDFPCSYKHELPIYRAFRYLGTPRSKSGVSLCWNFKV